MKPFSMILKSLALSLMLAGVAVASETVDINTADAATLDRVLDNVGAVKAEAIVAYREANGPFKSPEQLALVTGIGLKTVERNLDRISVGPAGGGDKAPKAAKPAQR